MTRRRVPFLLALFAILTVCTLTLGQQLVRRVVYQALTSTSYLENGRGQYDAALRHATLALKFDSNLAGAYGSRCIALSHLARYEEAIQQCTTAIQKPPFGDMKSVVYSDRAEAYIRLDRYDLAVADLTEAIRLNGLPYYHFQRGNAYAELGLDDQARSDLLTALDLVSRQAYGEEFLDQIREALGKLDD